jgi:hypothetical protein
MRWAFLSRVNGAKRNCRPKPTQPAGFNAPTASFVTGSRRTVRPGFKAEAGRYHLYVAYNCPWAHRTLIFRALKKLERAITVAYALPGVASRAGCSGVPRTFRSVPGYGQWLPPPPSSLHGHRSTLRWKGYRADPPIGFGDLRAD